MAAVASKENMRSIAERMTLCLIIYNIVLGLGEIFLVYSGDIDIGADDTRDREP